MKVTIWTLAKAGSHGELVVTAHTTKDDARRMLEHALAHEEIQHVGAEDRALQEAPVSDLQEAWRVHFDGPCLIESHEVDVPLSDVLSEVDNLVGELKGIVASAKAEAA